MTKNQTKRDIAQKKQSSIKKSKSKADRNTTVSTSLMCFGKVICNEPQPSDLPTTRPPPQASNDNNALSTVGKGKIGSLKSYVREPRWKHLEDDDGKKKSYKCPICERAFKFPSHLKFHAVSHFESNNHTCKVCQKSFHTKGSLNLHLRSHKSSAQWKKEIVDQKPETSGVATSHSSIQITAPENSEQNMLPQVPYQTLQLSDVEEQLLINAEVPGAMIIPESFDVQKQNTVLPAIDMPMFELGEYEDKIQNIEDYNQFSTIDDLKMEDSLPDEIVDFIDSFMTRQAQSEIILRESISSNSNIVNINYPNNNCSFDDFYSNFYNNNNVDARNYELFI